MIRAGLVAVVAGVAGLLAHLVVAVPPHTADLVAGGSWAAIGIGVLLILTELAQNGFGVGVFPLALGIAVMVAQRVTHFADRIHVTQPWLGIVVAVLVGIGAIAVALADDGDDAFIRLPFFAVASLLADILVDFGPGWDELVNVSTAFFIAAAAVAGAYIAAFGDVGPMDEYPDRWMVTATVGAGLAAVLITIMASFELARFVDVVLTLVAVLGGYLVVPLAGLFSLQLAVRNADAEDVGDAVDAMERGGAAIGALIAGYVAVAAALALFLWGPPLWLVIILVITAAGAAAAASWCGYRAYTELARLIRSGADHPRISAVLDELRRSGPVFRLLPGQGKP
ncbi:hypothetical protein [Labedaea rhizosphaerae]|uniref:Uncharacterized protein n=1 Tax=Labedaea rhizosphaerae TaxID=598644 RepID=A0A4V3CXE3_LABRH|nr:hypothetical protein [Labedaea rhizosphaerae]TDP89898.1 hypothetical protein EV186_11123 [Labedaea rhizosphaerae]